jgi:thiol-disulfide isomerase/thioredoxin
MSTDPIKVVLYWAEWCGPCKNYKPIWQEIVKKYQNNKNIIFENYVNIRDGNNLTDEDKEKMKPDGPITGDMGINSFPTVKVDEKEIDRSKLEEIIQEKLSGKSNQSGGSLNRDWKALYNKYKAKYIKLKRSLE